MAKEKYFRVGKIINTHGIKGQLKIIPTTDSAERFNDLDEVYIDLPDKKKAVHIAQVQFFKNTVILRFKEFNDINQVLEFKGKDLLIDRKDAVPLEEGEFYISDMIGAKVYTDDQLENIPGNSYFQKLSGERKVKPFGTVSRIFPTGANMVLEIRHKGKDVLIPLIKDCVLETNTEHEFFVIHILKGLI